MGLGSSAGGIEGCRRRGAAHSSQNFAPARFSAPQAEQRTGNGVAHSLQNLAPTRFSLPQLGQCMGSLYSFGHPGASKTAAPSPSSSHLLCRALEACFLSLSVTMVAKARRIKWGEGRPRKNLERGKDNGEESSESS